MSLIDELRTTTNTAISQQEQDRQKREQEAETAIRAMREKAKETALIFYKDKLPGQMKEAAARGDHSVKLYYDYHRAPEKFWMQELDKLCCADGFQTKWDSYTSDYGDTAAPCVSTSYFLVISWK